MIKTNAKLFLIAAVCFAHINVWGQGKGKTTTAKPRVTAKQQAPAHLPAKNFSAGLAEVKHNGKYGYINKAGKVVIPFQYGVA